MIYEAPVIWTRAASSDRKYGLALCFMYWRFGLTLVPFQKSPPVAYFMDTESSSTFCALLVPLNRNRCGMRTFRGVERSTDKCNVPHWLCAPVDPCTKFQCCISWDLMYILLQSSQMVLGVAGVLSLACYATVLKTHAIWAVVFWHSFLYLPAIDVSYWSRWVDHCHCSAVDVRRQWQWLDLQFTLRWVPSAAVSTWSDTSSCDIRCYISLATNGYTVTRQALAGVTSITVNNEM